MLFLKHTFFSSLLIFFKSLHCSFAEALGMQLPGMAEDSHTTRVTIGEVASSSSTGDIDYANHFLAKYSKINDARVVCETLFKAANPLLPKVLESPTIAFETAQDGTPKSVFYLRIEKRGWSLEELIKIENDGKEALTRKLLSNHRKSRERYVWQGLLFQYVWQQDHFIAVYPSRLYQKLIRLVF